MQNYTLYGLYDQLKTDLEKIAEGRKWSLAKLIIDVLEKYVKAYKDK
jgi:hypothetical protein